MRAIVGLLLLLVGLVVTGVEAAQRLPYEFFPQRHHQLQAKWANATTTGRNNLDAKITSELRSVELRLLIPSSFTSPPSLVRIYLVLPHQVTGLRSGAGLITRWETRGKFRAGTARPGDRVLLFEGDVSTTVLSDRISFFFTIDTRELVGPLRIEPYYEIERR